jgi:1-acyl-sn-glycerol-3-phosphate acyltransferase
MRISGWQLAGAFPDVPKFMLLVAPHTSNWDFMVAVSAKLALGLNGTWIGKDSLFRWPLRGLLRRLGGIPVDRNSPHGVVKQLVDTFAAREQMVFALTPEGTRKRVEHWRSGYWHVAHDARVPIVPVGLDYAMRIVFIGPPLTTTESLEDDERRLRAFFAGVHPKRPENYVK